MASHKLAIAKATFSAGLLRPDPTSLSRDEIANFHLLLNSVIIQCSPINVQKCKHWILNNIFPSSARFTALGKYLTALSISVAEIGSSDSKREPSVRRKRLHILYLVNDILYHATSRVNDASICGKLQPILMNLLGNAASFANCPKHQRKIVDLLSLWEEKRYYSKDYVDKLREAVKNASELGTYSEGSSGASAGAENGSTVFKNTKSAPFVMPAMHGDPSTPWFDLPAANLMPHIEPNSTRPIKPEMIKPLQLVAGPADATLVSAVKSLLEDVETIFGGGGQDEKATWDIDQLGQPIILDEITGNVLEGEGYYGWSHGFCEKIKRRRKGVDKPDLEKRGRRSQSRSRSLSSSPNRKRRRYSDSSSSSSPRRSNARRNYSSSRSRSPEQRPGFSRQRSRSRSYSASPRSRSRSQRKEPLETADTRVPPRAPLDSRDEAARFSQPAFPIPNPAAFKGQLTQPPAPPYNITQNQTYGWNHAPPPPPLPPSNYPHVFPNPSGQWPPPPLPPGPPPFNFQQQQQSYPQQPNFPPPPNFQQNLNYQQQTNFQQQGGFPIPPPPPPPPPTGWEQQNSPNGRAFQSNQSGWNGSQGRGGRGKYSGRGGW